MTLLQNKVAVITGATRGIGKATKELFEEHGCHVIPLSRRSYDLECPMALPTNILPERVDILVNCAAQLETNLFQMTSQNALRRLFQINVFSQVDLSQRVVKKMKEGGSIINLSSNSVNLVPRGRLNYSATKAAIESITQTMAKELGPKIRVNAVSPGLTDTDMGRLNTETGGIKMAQPIEIAKVILFLASDLSAHVTGQVIRADGGVFERN